MKVSYTRRGGLRRPSLGKCPGGRRWARSRDRSSNGRRGGEEEVGASPRESTSTRLQAPGPGRGAWELGPGTRIQHPGDLEAGPDSGGHLGQGEGYGVGVVGSWPGAEVLHRPAGCAQANWLPTLLLLSDPWAHSFFSRSAGFLVPGLSACWACACARRAASGYNAKKSGRGAFAAGLTPLVPGVRAPPPLRGVRAPQSSPNGNPARLGTGAGGTASVGLGKVCHLTGRERHGEPPLREAPREGGFPESSVNGVVMLAAQAPGSLGLVVSSACFPGVTVGVRASPRERQPAPLSCLNKKGKPSISFSSDNFSVTS